MRRGLQYTKEETVEIKIRRSGLSRAKVDALGTEVGGAGFLGCATKNLGPPGNLEANEAGGFQQSAGDSTGPQVNYFFSFLGHGYIYQDVPYLEASPGLEDSIHLSHGGRLAWHQIEDSIGDNHIRPFIGDG